MRGPERAPQLELADLPRDAWGGPIGARDARAALVARTVLRPGPLLRAGLLVIRAAESADVQRNITTLRGVEAPTLSLVEARVPQERAGGG